MTSDREHAVKMRLSGASYASIAEALEITQADAESLVTDEINVLTSSSPESATRLELARLDVLLMPVWRKAVRGDAVAVGQALKIINQRSTLLQKLDTTQPAQEGGRPPVADIVAALKAGMTDQDGGSYE